MVACRTSSVISRSSLLMILALLDQGCLGIVGLMAKSDIWSYGVLLYKLIIAIVLQAHHQTSHPMGEPKLQDWVSWTDPNRSRLERHYNIRSRLEKPRYWCFQ